MLARNRRLLLLLLTSALALVAPVLLQPAAAHAAPSEDLPVWRAQIRFETDGGDDMGTDDDIQVSLNNDNSTWIDYARDDFEAGDNYTYDLLLMNVRTVRDLQHLSVRKTGDDGWCIDNLTLLINGYPIYYRSFESSTTRCRWMDSDQWGVLSFTISSSTLRSSAYWRGFQAPPRPSRLTRNDFESRVQAVVGNWIEGKDHLYKWGHLYGSRYVEATPTDARTIHVDFDMTRIYNNQPDKEADGDFDMQFACSRGRLSLVVPGVLVDDKEPWPALDAPPVLVSTLRDQVRADFGAQVAALNAMLGSSTNVPCPQVLVDGGGNLIVPQNPQAVLDPIPVDH
jgi:hypothetical protein